MMRSHFLFRTLRRNAHKAFIGIAFFSFLLFILLPLLEAQQNSQTTSTEQSDFGSQGADQDTASAADAPVAAALPTSPANGTPPAAVIVSDDAQKTDKKVIGVEIIGNQIISTQTILSKMRTRKGAILRQQMVNDDIKRLYAAKYFDDIQIKLEELPEGYKLYVTVVEKPVIKEIQISGHTIYKDEKLRKVLGLFDQAQTRKERCHKSPLQNNLNYQGALLIS